MELTSYPSNPRTVLLKGDRSKYSHEYRVPTGGTVTPGMLLAPTADAGEADVHGTANGDTEVLIALEQGFTVDIPFGTFSAQGVDDDYGEGDLMFTMIGQKGDEFWVLLEANAGAITLADQLASAGDGTFQKWTTGKPLMVPLEAKADSASIQRIRARVI